MPKGVKMLDYPPPASAICDFCGRNFQPLVWNERTCIRCHQAPNQGRMEWSAYQLVLADYLREIGRRRKLSAANVARRFPGARSKAMTG